MASPTRPGSLAQGLLMMAVLSACWRLSLLIPPEASIAANAASIQRAAASIQHFLGDDAAIDPHPLPKPMQLASGYSTERSLASISLRIATLAPCKLM